MQQFQLPLVDPPVNEHGPHTLSAVARHRWDDAVAAELALPGVVILAPVALNGEVVDFCCVSASPRGAALLGSADGDMDGLTLTEVVGPWRRALELIRAYKRVYVGGVESTFLGKEPGRNCAGHVLHHVVRTPTGLTVMLTCPR